MPVQCSPPIELLPHPYYAVMQPWLFSGTTVCELLLIAYTSLHNVAESFFSVAGSEDLTVITLNSVSLYSRNLYEKITKRNKNNKVCNIEAVDQIDDHS